MADQGAGGGIESHLGGSTTRPNTNNEASQENVESRMKTQQEVPAETFSQPSQVSPRRFEERQSTPPTPNHPASLSRNASNASTSMSSTHSLTDRQSGHGRRSQRPLEPPVTKTTLSELDVTKIIHNPKLRHDINFDPELHFRPNLDGEKGKRKQEKANQFWNSLLEQLTHFVMDQAAFMEKFSDRDWCLPTLLKAVKDILQTLVPLRDRACVDEGLNVELLMQQFSRGVADLEKLAKWLSNVLKSHCAPMRDEWVDEMYRELSGGNRNNDMKELVKGMRTLLSVLEAMKLDVANHQIRCLRPVLIEDTVHFEQRFFFKKMQAGKLDISQARFWYLDAKARCSGQLLGTRRSLGDMSIFFEATSRLLRPSVSEKTIPNTFLFDEERMFKLRSDMADAINIEVCMRMYDELERLSTYNTTPSLSFLTPMVLDDAQSVNDFNFNTPPSRPSSLALSSAGSAHSSPRSSLVFGGNGGNGLSAPSARDVVEARNKSRQLYSSLVALVNTAPPATRHTSRWQALAPSMALQVYRFLGAPSEMLPHMEEKLMMVLADVHASAYQEVEEMMYRRLLTSMAKRVNELKDLSAVDLFTAATGGRGHNSGRSSSGRRAGIMSLDPTESTGRELREDAGIEDMALRLAHLGMLHWRVWSQLAYTEDFPIMDVPMANSSMTIDKM